jgi:glycogen operon protein
MSTLLLSQGVPMIVMGDEVRRTQKGNNNAYCQDNEVSWFDWKLVKRNDELLTFVKGLIALRKSQPTLRRTRFLTGRPFDPRGVADVNWFNHLGLTFNWENPSGGLVCWLPAPAPADDPEGNGRDLLLLFNGTGDEMTFHLPDQIRGLRWSLLIDTNGEAGQDIFPDLDGPAAPANRKVEMTYRSMQAYVADRLD